MTSKTLVSAIDRDQFRAWQEADVSRDAHTVVVTADWQVAAELEDNGQPYREVWSHLEAADIDRAQRLCQQLAAEWWRPFLGEIEYKGVRLADAMNRDMWYAFTAAIHANTVINRILEAEKPERLVLFADLKKATFWDPPDGPYPDVFNAVALWIARQRRLPVRRLSAKQWWPPPRAREAASQARRNLWEESPTPSGWPFELLDDAKKGTILIFLGRVDYHKQRGLVKALYESTDYNCVLLRRGRYESPEINNQVLGCWSDYLAWFPPGPSLQRELREAWQRFKRRQAEYTGDFPYIFANSYLDFQFRAFWKRIADAACIVDAATLVCNGLQPDLCIFGFDTYGPGVCWNRVAKLCGVTTLTILHGAISPHFYQYDVLNSEADYLVIEGDYSRQAFQALGRSPETIVTVGNLSPIEATLSRGPGNQDMTVLLMTSGCGSLVTPHADLTQVRHDWQHLGELIERRQDLHFIIKPHPRYDDYDFYRTLCARLPSNVELREGVSLCEVFPEVSVAVMVDYPSTAVLEAMLAGVPVVYLRSAMYKAAGLRSALDSDDVIYVDHVEDLETVLDDLLANPVARAEAQQRAKAFLADFLSLNIAEEGRGRFLALVKRLTGERDQSEPPGVPNQDTEILRNIFMLGGQLEKTRTAFRQRQLPRALLCALRILFSNPRWLMNKTLRFLRR